MLRTLGNFLDVTDGPEVGDAALNLYLEKLSGHYCYV